MITHLPPEQFIEDWKQEYISKGWPEDKAAALALGSMDQGFLGSHLAKSMNITNGIADTNSDNGDVLKIQDLMPNLALQILRYQNFTATWKRLNKKTAQSNTVEFNRVTSDGGRRGGGAINFAARDGGVRSQTSEQGRHNLNMAWYGSQYETYLPAQIMAATGITGGPAAGQAVNVNKAMAFNRVMRDINWATLHGDDTVNPYEPKGLLKQYRVVHNTENGITRLDLNGEPITETTLAIISQVLLSKGGQATDMSFGITVFADFQQQLLSLRRTGAGDDGVKMLAGTDELIVQALGQNYATCKIHRDVDLDPFAQPLTVAEDEAPTKPTSVTPTVGAAASANVFGRYLTPASYYYFVSSRGIKGESDTRASIVAAVGVHEEVSLAIKKSHADAHTFFIYRSETNDASTAELVGRVSCASVAVGSDATWVDDGEVIPGCSTGLIEYVQPMDAGHYSTEIRQFYPMTERPLPQSALANSSIYLCAFTPQVWTPGFGLVVENIGRWSNTNS